MTTVTRALFRRVIFASCESPDLYLATARMHMLKREGAVSRGAVALLQGSQSFGMVEDLGQQTNGRAVQASEDSGRCDTMETRNIHCILSTAIWDQGAAKPNLIGGAPSRRQKHTSMFASLAAFPCLATKGNSIKLHFSFVAPDYFGLSVAVESSRHRPSPRIRREMLLARRK